MQALQQLGEQDWQDCWSAWGASEFHMKQIALQFKELDKCEAILKAEFCS